MPPRRIILEVAVTTADEATRACAAGADRLELCSALEVGGVTPLPAAFLAVRDAVPTVPVYPLLRPRTGGFAYSDRELVTIQRDADWFLARGAAGVVFGLLTADGQIQSDRCRELVERSNGRGVFHRAFDFLPDPSAALEELIDVGFERVLTSGGRATAVEGTPVIARLVRQAAGRIGILPGGGITPANVTELVRATGCDQVHGSFRRTLTDPALSRNPQLAGQMGGGTTDEAAVRRVREQLDRL